MPTICSSIVTLTCSHVHCSTNRPGERWERSLQPWSPPTAPRAPWCCSSSLSSFSGGRWRSTVRGGLSVAPCHCSSTLLSWCSPTWAASTISSCSGSSRETRAPPAAILPPHRRNCGWEMILALIFLGKKDQINNYLNWNVRLLWHQHIVVVVVVVVVVLTSPTLHH